MSESNAVVPQSETAAPALSQIQRVLYIFTAPSKTFTDILRSSNWLLPFVLSLIFSCGFAYVVQKQVGWEKVADNVTKSNPKQAEAQEERMKNMTPEQIAGMRKGTGYFFAGVFGYGGPIFGLILAAIAAGLLLATVNFGFGGTATYGKLFAVWIFAGLPLVLKYVLAAVALFAGMAGESFMITNPVGTNPGYYFPPPDTPLWLYSLLTAVDIFTIWAVVLMIIGTAIVAKVKTNAAAIAVLGWWLFLTIIGVGYTAISS